MSLLSYVALNTALSRNCDVQGSYRNGAVTRLSPTKSPLRHPSDVCAGAGAGGHHRVDVGVGHVDRSDLVGHAGDVVFLALRVGIHQSHRRSSRAARRDVSMATVQEEKRMK